MSSSAAKVFRSLAEARRSSRRFQPDRRIPNSILSDILESTLVSTFVAHLRGFPVEIIFNSNHLFLCTHIAIQTQRSPSGFNLQPTHILMVQSPEMKTKLANHAMLGIGNQYRVKDSSAVAVFLADLEVHKRIDRIFQLENGCRDPNYLATMPIASSFLLGEGHVATLLKQIATDTMSEIQPMPSVEPVQAWSYKNAGLMAQSYTLAATSHDLATCMMEGYDARRAKDVLRVPDRYAIPIMVATGYEYEDPSTFVPTPRLCMDEVVFGDTFGEPLDLSDNESPTGDDDDMPEAATAAS